jgi:uncharacterized protein YabN with tetrapyrrole methylase and pyrophosphatase domain
MKEIDKVGSIVIVGTGMTLGAHITPICRSHIEQADVVFCSCHPMHVLWLKQMNKDVRNLQSLYAEGKDRRKTYQQMIDTMMAEVRNGKNVVGAFYGHPGVFAWAPHKVIEKALSEGYSAHMEPGISAEDCLYAHIGVDPGRVGSQHFEASQFMFYKRNIDVTAYLILWQVAIAGDRSIKRFYTENVYRGLLVEMLNEYYPLEHKVVLYECPTLATESPRIEWITLEELATADVSLITTLMIPPCKKLQKNVEILNKLSLLDKVDLTNTQ